MSNQVLNLVFDAISIAGTWFFSLLDSSGMSGVWISAIVVYGSYRFILSPVFGYAHSDTIKKSYNALKSKKEE